MGVLLGGFSEEKKTARGITGLFGEKAISFYLERPDFCVYGFVAVVRNVQYKFVLSI
jgi:hypothetical protein